MNGRDMMPACARIAAVDPAMADRMWNTYDDDDGRDLATNGCAARACVLCAACPMRLDCISRALVNGWKDKAVYGGLEYASRWTLARLIARDLHIADGCGLHRIPRSRVRDWLAEHPDWAERMRRDGRDYWRRAKRRQRSRAANTRPTIRAPSDPTRAEGPGSVRSLFLPLPAAIRVGRGINRNTEKPTNRNTETGKNRKNEIDSAFILLRPMHSKRHNNVCDELVIRQCRRRLIS